MPQMRRSSKIAPLLSVLTATVSAIALAGALAGCGQTLSTVTANTASITPSAPPAAKPVVDEKTRTVRIALLLPTGGYGEAAQIARGMKQAAELALFDANNPAIQLIPKDDGGTPQGAAKAAEAAIGEGAEIILGPLFSQSVHGVAPVAQKASVPVLAFSTDPSVATPGIYLMSFLAAEEVQRVITYAASQGKRRYAALIPATAYGQAVEPAFRRAVAEAGGEIVSSETYTPDASSILAASKRITQAIDAASRAGQPIDALFVPAGPETVAQIGPMLAYSGIDTSKVKLIGTSAWDQPAVSRDEHLIGGWYAAPDPVAFATFSEKFQKTFGTPPPRLATLAYDAMGLALELSTVPPPQRFAPDRLTRAQGFTGIDGPVRFDRNGLSRRSLAVLEVERYRSVVIDPAGKDEAAQLSSAADPSAY